MSLFDEEFGGPLFRVGGNEQYANVCNTPEAVAGGCDLVLGLNFCRYRSESAQTSTPAPDNVARFICHGLRPRTLEEAELAALTERPAAASICDLEIVYTPTAEHN